MSAPSQMPWNAPEVVARFSSSPPNPVLLAFAEKELKPGCNLKLLDIGCGAGCNAVPLAQQGWDVTGLDLSKPMLEAANRRAEEEKLTDRLTFQMAPMDQLPVGGCSFDFIVAHGIWNLAGSSIEFRTAVREAARAAKPGAPLFVYTFSLNTLPETCSPVAGETFVYDEFAGRPQCFLTEEQLISELKEAGFNQEPGFPITEYPQRPGTPKPAILEGIFRRAR
jgi:ubiquinone/menaquinone biosynthesis C-methylase UbiE